MSSGGLFSWNPAAGETPDTLKRRRQVAEAMLASAVGQPASTIGGGLAALGQAIGGRLALGRVNRAEAAGRQGAADVFSKLFGGGAAAPAAPGDVLTGGGGTDTLSGTGGGIPDVAAQEAYIRASAPKYGVDPDVAVKVARSEGLQPGTWQSNVMNKGVRETSYGPYQLLVGGGLGDEFQRTTGLNAADPGTWQKQIDFALGQAAKQGWTPWHGAAKVGVDSRTGIGGGTPAVTAALTGGAGGDTLAGGGGRDRFDFSRYATGGAAARPDSFSGLQPAMSSGLGAMISSAPPDIQAELKVLSGYRSPETQERLWQGALKKYGSASAARKWVAPPGRSQHGAGNAIDWKFGTQRARDWVHKNAAQYGFAFPLGNEPWHMEVAGARGSRGGPPVRQNASGIGRALDSTGGGAGGVGVPAVAQALMGTSGTPAVMEALTGAGPRQEAVASTGSPAVYDSLAAAGLIDPAAKDDALTLPFRPAGGPTPYSAGNIVLGGGSANAGTLTPVPDPTMRPAIVPAVAPEAPPVAPAAVAAPGVAPVAQALGYDPLPQTSAEASGWVPGQAHEGQLRGAPAVRQALSGGGGTNALAGGDGRGLFGRIFGGRTGTPPAVAGGGGGGVPPAAATGVPGAGGSAGTEGAPGAGGGFSPRAQAAIAALQNPWLNEGQQAVAKTILDQEIAQADPKYQADLAKIRYDLAVAQAKDPVDLAKAKLDYDQALHPELVPPTQAEAAQIEQGQAQTDINSQRLKFDIEQGRYTPDIKNYEYYVEDMKKRGAKPEEILTPLGYETAVAEAKASRTSVNTVEDFETFKKKEALKASNALFGKMAEDYGEALSFQSSVGRLGGLVENIKPGTSAGLANWIREQTGIEVGENASDLQAVKTMINYLAPRMRVPGTGASSNFDANQFVLSLPSLLGTPEGNQMVMDTLSGMADQRLRIAEIAQDQISGIISPEDAVKQMRTLPDPFASFKQADKKPAVTPADIPPNLEKGGSVTLPDGTVIERID